MQSDSRIDRVVVGSAEMEVVNRPGFDLPRCARQTGQIRLDRLCPRDRCDDCRGPGHRDGERPSHCDCAHHAADLMLVHRHMFATSSLGASSAAACSAHHFTMTSGTYTPGRIDPLAACSTSPEQTACHWGCRAHHQAKSPSSEQSRGRFATTSKGNFGAAVFCEHRPMGDTLRTTPTARTCAGR
jgi:hypothetical protein